MNVMVVCPGLRYYFFNDVKDKNSEVFVLEEPFVSEKNIFFKCTERLSKKLGFWRLYKKFINNWKKIVTQCSDVIIFDSAFSISLVKSLMFFNPNISIHVYLWNPVFLTPNILKKLKKVNSLIKIYSFDKNDCKRYNFSFSPMIYFFQREYLNFPLDNNFEYDIVFIGYIKNRGSYLSNLYNLLSEYRLNLFFYVVNNTHTKEKTPFVLQDKCVDYNSYKNYIQKTKAILDITQEGQIGLTIRTLESVYYGKKLITNNFDIKNYDFYNSNNIFVLGVDDINNLKEFIDTPYVQISWDIVKQYNFYDWAIGFKTR